MEPFLLNSKHNIFKKISDEISLVLRKNRSKNETQIETLYLLIALGQLGREYRLSPAILCSYFNIEKNKKGIYEIHSNLNYFSITVLLFYIKDIKLYQGIKDALKIHIINKFTGLVPGEWKSNTEMVLLILDLISCPYLNGRISKHLMDKLKRAKADNIQRKITKYKRECCKKKYEFKKKLLNLIGITNDHSILIEQEKFWFTKWTEFDFGMELEAKRSQEVY